MEDLRDVRHYLGGAKAIGSPQTELDFVAIIRKGLPASALESLRTRTELSEETIVNSLRIAKRTAARRKQQGDRLKPSESERLFRLAKTFATATDVLGTKENARQWLLSPNLSLGGNPPIKLLDTGIGFQQVIDVLGRIEFGVYS